MPATTSRHVTDAVYLHPDDNICVAARNLADGTTLDIADTQVQLAEAVAIGHKIAVRPDSPRAITSANTARSSARRRATLPPGQWVHSHNLVNGDFVRDYAKADRHSAAADAASTAARFRAIAGRAAKRGRETTWR